MFQIIHERLQMNWLIVRYNPGNELPGKRKSQEGHKIRPYEVRPELKQGYNDETKGKLFLIKNREV